MNFIARLTRLRELQEEALDWAKSRCFLGGKQGEDLRKVCTLIPTLIITQKLVHGDLIEAFHQEKESNKLNIAGAEMVIADKIKEIERLRKVSQEFSIRVHHNFNCHINRWGRTDPNFIEGCTCGLHKLLDAVAKGEE